MQTSAQSKVGSVKPAHPRITHIAGPQGSGKTTLAVSLVNKSRAAGISARLVDSEDFLHVYQQSVDRVRHANQGIGLVVLEHLDESTVQALEHEFIIRMERRQ